MLITSVQYVGNLKRKNYNHNKISLIVDDDDHALLIVLRRVTHELKSN